MLLREREREKEKDNSSASTVTFMNNGHGTWFLTKIILLMFSVTQLVAVS